MINVDDDTDIGAEVRKIIQEQMGYSGLEGIDTSKTLEELGVDSMDRMEIAIEFGDHFEVDLPRSLEGQSVRKIESYYQSKADIYLASRRK